MFNLKQVRNFFTLYFIPLIPLNVAGRYVECGSCGGTFSEETKSYDPEKERQEMHTRMLRVMIMAALADGEVDEVERRAIKDQYQELTGFPVAAATLETEIGLAKSSTGNLNSFVGGIAHNLSQHGKAMVVKLAFHTMSAAGDLRPGHQEQLTKLADTLKIPRDQYMELIDQLSQPDSEQSS